MNGQCTINGKDLWSVFGAFIIKGNYNQLLTPAKPRKRMEYEYTDADGIDVDTDSPLTYEPKRYAVKVGLTAIGADNFWSKYNALIAELSVSAPLQIYFSELDKTFELLYEGITDFSKKTVIADAQGRVTVVFTVNFLEQDPNKRTKLQGDEIPFTVTIEGTSAGVERFADIERIVVALYTQQGDAVLFARDEEGYEALTEVDEHTLSGVLTGIKTASMKGYLVAETKCWYGITPQTPVTRKTQTGIKIVESVIEE